MRKLLFTLTVALLAIALVPATGIAGHGHGQGPKPKGPKVEGAGFSAAFGKIKLEAQAKPNKPVKGHFEIKKEKARGKVTCLTVSGKQAFAGGVDRKTGRAFLVFVEDNGRPGKGHDRHYYEPRATAPTQADCDSATAPATAAVIERGNYKVRAP